MGLLLNMFQQFWPSVLMDEVVYRLKLPLIIATYKGKEYEFNDKESYEKWQHRSDPHKMKYFKGLGSYSSTQFSKFINSPSYLQKVSYNGKKSFDALDMAFSRKMADDRKEWLIEDYVEE